jgi:hypothetical protein
VCGREIPNQSTAAQFGLGSRPVASPSCDIAAALKPGTF